MCSVKTSFTLSPVGWMRTPYDPSFTPHQPPAREIEAGAFRLEVNPEFAEALHRLNECRYLALLSYFDKNQGDVALRVKPPWLDGVEVGLFASRSPKRPNPIGLHVVRLLKIEGNTLFTGPIDLYDSTPILDIKPYFVTLDAKADAGDGWMDSVEGKAHLLEHMLGIPHEHGEHGHDHAHGHEHQAGHQAHDHGEHSHRASSQVDALDGDHAHQHESGADSEHDHHHHHHSHTHSHSHAQDHIHEHGEDEGHSHSHHHAHSSDHGHQHGVTHEHLHEHEHRHGDESHTHVHHHHHHHDSAPDHHDHEHSHTHEHPHAHAGEHAHSHGDNPAGEHSHAHTHQHAHPHAEGHHHDADSKE